MHYRYPSDKALKSPATKNLGFFFLNQKLLWAPDASRFCLVFLFVFFFLDRCCHFSSTCPTAQ